MVAAAVVLSYRANLRPGELTTLRVRNLVKSIRPGTAGATGRFLLVIREEQSDIPSKNTDIRRFRDPRQAGSVVDGWTLERSGSESSTKCTLDSCESVRSDSRCDNDLRRTRVRQVGRCGIQPETWDFMKKFRRSRRNPATGSLAQFVKCPQVPKSVKTSECYAIGGAQAGRIRRCTAKKFSSVSSPLPRRTVFPWTGHRCFVEILGILRRHGVSAEIWSPWYGTEESLLKATKRLSW